MLLLLHFFYSSPLFDILCVFFFFARIVCEMDAAPADSKPGPVQLCVGECRPELRTRSIQLYSFVVHFKTTEYSQPAIIHHFSSTNLHILYFVDTHNHWCVTQQRSRVRRHQSYDHRRKPWCWQQR